MRFTKSGGVFGWWESKEMELDEADAYTAAALFTLALHQSQVSSPTPMEVCD